MWIYFVVIFFHMQPFFKKFFANDNRCTLKVYLHTVLWKTIILFHYYFYLIKSGNFFHTMIKTLKPHVIIKSKGKTKLPACVTYLGPALFLL